MTTAGERPRPAAPRPLPLQALPRLLFRREWLVSTLVVLAGMAFLARLGFWQLDRLEQRRARNALIAAQLAAAPLTLTPGDPLPDAPDALRNRLARATGQFDFAHQVVVVQQRYQGRLGNHLLAPLVLADGQTAVLVDRGWVPADVADPQAWQVYDEAGPVTVEGFLQPAETLRDGRSIVPDAPQTAWFRRDVAALAAQMPYALLPVYLQQAPVRDGGGTASGAPARVLPDLTLSEGNHLSYALQWFSFALILGGAYLVYVRRHARPGDAE